MENHLVANYPRIVSGAHNPGDFNGISRGNVHKHNWGELTHLLSGMNHQVVPVKSYQCGNPS